MGEFGKCRRAALAGIPYLPTTYNPLPTTHNLPHIDLLRLRHLRRRLRERYLEHAVLERRVAGIRVDAFGERDRAIEASVAALGPIVTVMLVLDVVVPLAANDEQVIFDLDVDIVARQARELGADDHIFPALEDLHLRCPQTAREGLEATLAAAA